MRERIITFDFETMKIEPRPVYPPKPVGLAWHDGSLRGYEPCRTASEWRRCKSFMQDAYRNRRVPLFHHAGFDLDVAEVHLGVPWPAYHHDTLLLAYLDDPRASTFSLKPLAERHLGEPPAERDALMEWILANVPQATKKTWGAYISEAPFELVRPYAIGDCTRTTGLFKHYTKTVLTDEKMVKAYDRERRLTHVIIKMERRGVPVAVGPLTKGVAKWKAEKLALEEKLFKDLKVKKKDQAEFPWAGKHFAHQLVASGAVARLPKTMKGNDSTSAEALAPLIAPKIGQRLELRAQLQTCIGTFAEPWLAQARHGGRFYARLNQVRQDYHSGGVVGTTTGRISMTPNLQNVIRSDKGTDVPMLRAFLIPPKGHWWLKRDYSQQELRIFAHYEEGELLERYKASPTIDVHVVTGQILAERAGVTLERRTIKDINFGVLYGMGRDKMARKLKLPLDVTIKTLAAYHKALPGIKQLQKELKRLSDNNEPIYTWGGRRYFCEPPRVVVKDGRAFEQTYEYKLLNLLVQGSAADATKEAMLRYDATGWNEDDRGPLLLQVHDELDAEAAAKQAKPAMKALREAMESLEFDVPLLSDGSASRVSWDETEGVTW